MIGILGGAFDPIHNGHMGIALAALEQLKLDQVLLIPTFVAAHKSTALFSYTDRVTMARLACADYAQLHISDIESTMPTPSYTVHTLQALRQVFPDQSFVLILGEDSFNALPTWYRWQTLPTLCKIAVFPRTSETGQSSCKTGTGHHLDALWLESAHWPVSSTQVRDQLAQGQSIEQLVPPQVCQWLHHRSTPFT